jgi:hypothetical protein
MRVVSGDADGPLIVIVGDSVFLDGSITMLCPSGSPARHGQVF